MKFFDIVFFFKIDSLRLSTKGNSIHDKNKLTLNDLRGHLLLPPRHHGNNITKRHSIKTYRGKMALVLC